MTSLSHRRGGWTLIEVLTAIAVVGLLLTLLVPAVMRAREASNRARCANNLRQLTLASHACHDATGALPPYSTGQPGTKVFAGWWLHLLPYADEMVLYDDIFVTADSLASAGGTLSSIVVNEPQYHDRRFPLLMCSSDPTRNMFFDGGTTNYIANWYVLTDGVKGCYAPAQKLAGIRSGLSNAILFAEGYASCNGLNRQALIACGTHNFGITWHGKPSDDPSYLPINYLMFEIMPIGFTCSNLRAQTSHTQMPAAFADGSVRFIDADMPLTTWTKLMKPRHGF